MDIHITIDGQIIDLQGFLKEEMKHYSKCLMMFQAKISASKLLEFIQKNLESLTDNEDLYKVIYDFYERLAIEQNIIESPSDLTWFQMQPTQRDTFISASEAARRKKLDPSTIVSAVKRGDIAAHKTKGGKLIPKEEPEGRWKLSAKSVELYEVNSIQQKKRLKN